ncbi:MAG: hypothetical protein KTR27_10865 [Leptolyngbyaceae cyanobacterium MAG.088]|nr:hypothetical protein [Leptolyngbyaceae cyanobacterium MAG.088]
MKIVKRLEHRYVSWLTRPAQNAAGRMGLYRIIYSLFYLWFLSHMQFAELSLVPTDLWDPTVLFSRLSPLPGIAYPTMEILLVIALVLLLVGYKTRLATLTTLLMGFGLAIFRTGLLTQERTILTTTFYVPLFMLLSNWGATYSIDALLRQNKGLSTIDPKDSSWRYIWPARGLLTVIALLFLSATITKCIQIDWLANPRFVGDFVLHKGVESYLRNGFPIHPLGPQLGRTDALAMATQYGVLLFEGAFVLVLFSRLAQAIICRITPIFHSMNTLLLGIPFISVVSIYAAFPDWQNIYETFYPNALKLTDLAKLSSTTLITGSVGLALAVGALWNTTPIPRQIFGLFDLFNYQTLWFAILPFVFIWIFRPLWQHFKSAIPYPWERL